MKLSVKHSFFAGRRSVLALLMILMAAGCSNKLNQTHKQNVNAAENRWLSARSDLMLKMAQRQFDTGDLDQAEKTLREAVVIDPKNPRLHVLAGRVAIERGKLEHAANLFRFAIELRDDIPDAYYYQALVFQRWQQYEPAFASYEKAFSLQGDNPAYLIAASEMLVALDRWQDAVDLLKSKMDYFDQNAGIRVAVGQIYLVQKKFEDAAPYLKAAATLRPDDPQMIELLVTALVGAGQIEPATRELERLIAQPGYGERRDLQRALAECYRRALRFEDAKGIYLTLTRTDPTDSETWVKLGEIALETEDWNGALLSANRVTALAPKRYEGPLIAGMVARERGQIERSLSLFERAAALAPDNALPVILRGLTLESAGRPAEASAAYAEALIRQPGDEQARELLANVERSQR